MKTNIMEMETDIAVVGGSEGQAARGAPLTQASHWPGVQDMITRVREAQLSRCAVNSYAFQSKRK